MKPRAGIKPTMQSAAEHCFMDTITSSGRNVFEAEKFVVSMSKIKRDRGIVTTKSEHEVMLRLLPIISRGRRYCIATGIDRNNLSGGAYCFDVTCAIWLVISMR